MSGENDYLITYDGTTYPLHQMVRRGMLNISGLGSMPAEYQEQQGYKQHGVTILDYRLAPREISFQIKDTAKCRDDYWTGRRTDLINALRMNRGGPLVYRKILPDGSRRDIEGWLSDGFSTPNDQGAPDIRTLNATFRLRCPDPTFFDPGMATIYLTEQDTELVFPIDFPIQFGGSSIGSDTINYTGTWRAYPTLVITGPYNWLRVTNNDVGASLIFTVPRVAADTLTIDLTPGAITATDQDGTSVLDEIAPESNLIGFYIQAGSNEIVADANGNTNDTSVTMTYNTRYIAL